MKKLHYPTSRIAYKHNKPRLLVAAVPLPIQLTFATFTPYRFFKIKKIAKLPYFFKQKNNTLIACYFSFSN